LRQFENEASNDNCVAKDLRRTVLQAPVLVSEEVASFIAVFSEEAIDKLNLLPVFRSFLLRLACLTSSVSVYLTIRLAD